MDFLNRMFENDPTGTFTNILIFLLIFLCITVAASFFYDLKKNSYNLKKIEVSERALKDLIEAFRSLEQQTNAQKKILDEYIIGQELAKQTVRPTH